MPNENGKPKKKQVKNTKAKWVTIKSAYICREDEPSLKQLCEEFDVFHSQIGTKSKKENWVKLREEHWHKVGIKLVQKLSSQQAKIRVGHLKKLDDTLKYLMGLVKDKKLKAKADDIVKIIKEIERLYGAPDSTTEVNVKGSVKVIEDIPKRSRVRDILTEMAKLGLEEVIKNAGSKS